METVVPKTSQRDKLLIKGLLIAAMALVLLIPAYFVQKLIAEREARQKEAFSEVSSKWAGKQTFTGPVLIVPYHDTQYINNEVKAVRKLAYVLPEKLVIESTANPEKRYRGIFQVMLYSAGIRVKGKFNPDIMQQLNIDSGNILWQQAYVAIGLSDAKGLREEIKLNWNGADILLNPSSINNSVMREAFTSPVNIEPGKEIEFSSVININGSEQLLFAPVGKETTVTLRSAWPDPSFTGRQLPDHQITDSGFVATWKSLAHTRGFPQAWKDASYNIHGSSFGVDLLITVNGYHKTMRSVKYAILCILLTFAAFFIIEIVNKTHVHLFQYALIGLALVLFYTLLLSFSEYTGFNIAYIIATLATVGLITWFVKGVLQSTKLTAILSIVLVMVYSYVFTVLQLQDYSLLLGSIGLFLALAVIMHFSRKIQW